MSNGMIVFFVIIAVITLQVIFDFILKLSGKVPLDSGDEDE